MNFDQIPDELRELDQWVTWRFEERDGKTTKVPYTPAGGRARARVNDPETWGNFEEAAAAGGDGDGIGFVLTADDPYCLVDLDDCISPFGVVDATATQIVKRLDSYAEVSPSNRGLHVIGKAVLNGNRNRTSKTEWGGEFEVYDRSRFVCMTGNAALDAAATAINECQEQLDQLVGEMFPKK